MLIFQIGKTAWRVGGGEGEGKREMGAIRKIKWSNWIRQQKRNRGGACISLAWRERACKKKAEGIRGWASEKGGGRRERIEGMKKPPD